MWARHWNRMKKGEIYCLISAQRPGESLHWIFVDFFAVASTIQRIPIRTYILFSFNTVYEKKLVPTYCVNMLFSNSGKYFVSFVLCSVLDKPSVTSNNPVRIKMGEKNLLLILSWIKNQFLLIHYRIKSIFAFIR